METSHRVGLKLPNLFSLHDMSGNLREWTLDEWTDDYSSASSDGHHYIGSLPPCSYHCDDGGASRVTRGGAWRHVEDNVRVSHRGRNGASTMSDYLGFRVRKIP